MEAIISEGLRLDAHFARPAGSSRVPAVVLLPGFPRGTNGAALLGHTYPPLCDHLSEQTGWAALTLHFRGTGASEGDFSIPGWLADIRAAVDALSERRDISSVWLAGFRLGGSLSIVAAADDARVRGVATFGAPAALKSWVRDPEWFLGYCRRVGVLRSEGFPADQSQWISDVESLDILGAAERIDPRPLLIVHGTADDVISADDARALYARGGPSSELRIVPNGAHRLRHDPRAIAILLGWLTRA